MSGNRVDELEAKVRELEATVEGLTDELVETKERLGAIEDETGIEPDALESRLSRTSRNRGDERAEADDEVPEGADSTEGAETTDGDDTDDGTADSTGDDIIVA